MARFKFSGLDKIQTELEERGARVSGVVNHALYAGAKVMKQEQAQAMKDYKLKDTGDLIKSIKSGKIRKTDTGKMITVGPDGVDRKGVRNMEKAAIAQYGSSREPARPWATLARVRGENKVRERMAEVFREEISKAGGGKAGGEEE